MDELQGTMLEGIVMEERVKTMLKADRGNEAQLISWKIRDFTQNDNSLCSFVTSIDIRFTERGQQREACYAVKLNPCSLSEIYADSYKEKPSLRRSPSPDRAPTVKFTLDSEEEAHRAAPHDLITEDHIKFALTADKGDCITSFSWEFEDLTQVADSLAFYVTRVIVNYCDQSNNKHTSYVVKLHFCLQEEVMDDFAHMMLLKETNFYMNLAPELSSELNKFGMPPLRIPKCFHTCQQLGKGMIFLEDLRPRGFVMFDQQKGMDYAHVTLTIEELARLHASSILLQKKYTSEELRDRCDFPRAEVPNSKDKDHINSMLSWGIESSLDILKHTGGSEKAIAWISRHQSSVFKIMGKMIHSSPPFDAICHGYCWNSSTLFRYNDQGEPLEVMLLNLQWNRVASVATDLNYILLTSLTGDLRQRHLNAFLASYFKTFKDVLDAGGLRVPFTLQELRQEYRNKHLFGLICAMVVVPIMLWENNEVLQSEENLSDKTPEEREELKHKVLASLNNNPLLHPRFLAIFREMENEGVFDRNFSSDNNH